MNNIILFDHDHRDQLLPFTFTRPVCEIRIGILTIKEKWQLWLDGSVSYITQEYLSEKFPIRVKDENHVINGAVLPNPWLCNRIKELGLNEALVSGSELIAAKLPLEQFEALMNGDELKELIGHPIDSNSFIKIDHIWDIFKYNDQAIRSDFELLTRARTTQTISSQNLLIDKEFIFVEEGAKIEGAILNASRGPIYIGKYAEIMEGSLIRGPVALCDNSTVKMGAKIYGATTVGPHCKVGGEINNVVFFGYSNKAHDGFLGNSVIAEWCNIGSGTESSNLKNTYDIVKIWDYPNKKFVKSDLQFAGLFMGDHSKCAIGTTFNTGTVVGVACNIFGEGFPRNFIPSFSWGGKQGFKTYRLHECFDMIDRVMTRRDRYFKEDERNILADIFEQEAQFRTWEKSKSTE